MKGLSLTPPWGTLIALGAKRIETRGWRTAYRGLLAIHQTKGRGEFATEADLWQHCLSEPFAASLLAGGYGDPGRLPRGRIVAVVRLIAVHPTVPEGYATHDPRGSRFIDVGEPERSFGTYAPGRYAWLLADVRRLPEPVPCRGYQQLWDVPAEVEAAIRAQVQA